jgi:hypothetical protein
MATEAARLRKNQLNQKKEKQTWAVVELDLPGRWATIGPRPD